MDKKSKSKKSFVFDSNIFSGEYSREMWHDINHAKTKKELRQALNFVCCRIQELELEFRKLKERLV